MERSSAQNTEQKREFKFSDHIIILMKWRKLIVINVILVCLITVIYTLVMPKTFTASSVVMPPQKEEGLLSSLGSKLPVTGILGGLSSISEETNLFIAILKSRTIAESVIKKFNLMERYESNNLEEAIRTFEGNLEIIVDEEGTLRVTMSARTPFYHFEEDEKEARQLCSDMANFILSELDRINKQLETQRAKYHRIFIEERYEENKEDLRNLEEDMRKFGEKYGIVSLPDQVSAVIEAASELESKIIIKEVELEALKKTINSGNPLITKKEIEIQELKRKLNEFAVDARESDALKTFPIFSEIPDLGVKYLRLKRELEVQNLIYEFLTTQYEQAKLQEAKDTPTVQILDKAIPPIRRSAPERAFIVIVAFFTAIILSVFLVFFLESWNDLRLKTRKLLKMTSESSD